MKSVIVLGAGIQGCSTALALAHAGWSVTLVDRRAEAWSETSLRGEGKLHLGYVYAAEPDRETATLMLDGAFAFQSCLDEWTGGLITWDAMVSKPFVYGIHADSMVDVETLLAHYAWIDSKVEEKYAQGLTYPGDSRGPASSGVCSPRSVGLSDKVATAYATREIALSPRILRSAVIAAMKGRGITFRGMTTVLGVERTHGGFRVTTLDGSGDNSVYEADAVVNCLWHGLLEIDKTMGIAPLRPWIHRLKYGITGRAADLGPSLPSATFALGPFGDVVSYADGSVYMSWYPECMTDFTHEMSVPDTWEPALSGVAPVPVTKRLVHASIAALQDLVAHEITVDVDTVAAGIVVASGTTDIDDPDSELHGRTRIGPRDYDGYVSVETGKFTTAPLFASQVVEILQG